MVLNRIDVSGYYYPLHQDFLLSYIRMFCELVDLSEPRVLFGINFTMSKVSLCYFILLSRESKNL